MARQWESDSQLIGNPKRGTGCDNALGAQGSRLIRGTQNGLSRLLSKHQPVNDSIAIGD
jgi:hypothetical protein